MEGKVKMYQCSGWQNVAEYVRRGAIFPISVSYYPTEHAHAARDYTHSRNESLEELIENLKKDAGVTGTLRYKIVED